MKSKKENLSTTIAGHPKYLDKKIIRRLKGLCPICGKKTPGLMGTFAGKKGCKHYEEEMKYLAEVEDEPRYSVAELEKILEETAKQKMAYFGGDEAVEDFIEFLKDQKKVQEVLK